MGWNPPTLGGREFLILSTHGGIRAPDGTPIALGYHTGHWEVGLLMEAAAAEFTRAGAMPFAAYVHRSVRRPHAGHDRHVRQPAVSQRRGDGVPPADPLAADAQRRARRRHLRQGPAGDDDGAGGDPRSAVRARARRRDAAADDGEDAGKVQTIGVALRRTARSRWRRRPSWAAAPARRPAAAASSSARRRRRRSSAKRSACRLPHSALAPSGQPIWLDMARRSARALMTLAAARHHDARHPHRRRRSATRWSSTRRSAARRTCCCTSRRSPTPPGCRGPTVEDWARINRSVPRLVDALPNGPRNHPTVQVFLAGGVPEVMLHLRRAGLLDTSTC